MTARTGNSMSDTYSQLLQQHLHALQNLNSNLATTNRIRLGLYAIAIVCVLSQMAHFGRVGNHHYYCPECDTTQTEPSQYHLLEEDKLARKELQKEAEPDSLDPEEQSLVKELKEEGYYDEEAHGDGRGADDDEPEEDRKQQQQLVQAKANPRTREEAKQEIRHKIRLQTKEEPQKREEAKQEIRQKISSQEKEEHEDKANDTKKVKEFEKANEAEKDKEADEKVLAKKEKEAAIVQADKKGPAQKITTIGTDSGPAKDLDSTTIRSWGCARNETPFIFVHIGKAGGGGVRSRMAAAALEYNRSGWHRTHEDDTYYYPIYDSRTQQMHKAKFASSKMTNMIPKSTETEYGADFAYEGFGPCGATTPLGQAIACPIDAGKTWCADHDNDGISQARCDLVYMGHNLLGTELHWLPTEFLMEWWKTTPWYTGNPNSDDMYQAIAGRHNKTKECDIVGPYVYRQFLRNYDQCFQPREKTVDTLAKTSVGGYKANYNLQWARVMASLPTLRVTVMREPFSWLTSKFFWHSRFYSRNGELVRGHISEVKNEKRARADQRENKPTPRVIMCDDIDEIALGWGAQRAITYILYMCGEHCLAGYAKGSLTIQDMERQAAYNLRNSFAVVGILQKTDDFYDMVTKRVYYMDTYLNPNVKGKSHASGSGTEERRCKDLYKDPKFQQKVMDKSPAIAALHRLYNIAVEVNEFQEKELAQCPILNDSSGSIATAAIDDK